MFKGLKTTFWFRELAIQVLVYGVVLLFYAIDRRDPVISFTELAFYFHLALQAIFVSYFVIPRFLYKKKYLLFTLVLLTSIVVAMLIEELFLEQIFYPDTRANKFPGIFFTLMSILPATSILVGFKLGWDALNTRNEIDRLQALIKESQLEFLKAQINPHFLFNTLNNLYAYAIENSPKTPQVILDLSAVLRYMLYDCKAERVSLLEEIRHLEEFVKVSEMQIENRGKVTFNKAFSSQRSYQIAPLILIVFVENAFKHSTSSLASDIEIFIDLKIYETGTLNFYCRNTFGEQSTPTDGGIGLKNVRKRLELIYPEKYELDIRQDTPSNYEVFLSIELDVV